MSFAVTVKDTISPALKRWGKIARRPWEQGRGRLVRRRAQKVFARQFVGGGYYGPSGNLTSWTPTKAFGTKLATVPPLGGASSSLLAASRGGPGGSWAITATRVSLTFSLVYAAVHDRGASIPVTAKSRAFVRGAFGVNLRKDKKAFIIPRRPLFDARAPQWAEAGRGVLVEAFTEAAR